MHFFIKLKPSYTGSLVFILFSILLIFNTINTNIEYYYKYVLTLIITFQSISFIKKYCLLSNPQSIIALIYQKTKNNLKSDFIQDSKITLIQKDNTIIASNKISKIYKTSIFIIFCLKINNRIKTYIIFNHSISKKDFRLLSLLSY